ncbi:hypothetical protein BGX28_005890 [Mortierella sp. GBA30]|nr:hypothetical protein BGX28_005890 [Mortierella sp. GBA30]
MSPVSSPLELPEIIHNIGIHLPRNDQVHFIRVCSLWHQAVVPLIWHDITLSSQKRSSAKRYGRPPLEVVRKYNQHIRKVKVIADYSKSGKASEPNIDVWKEICGISALKELTLIHDAIGTSGLPYFEKTCTHLKALHLYLVHANIPAITLSAIEELSIFHYCRMDAVAFISRCPSLKTLRFEVTGERALEQCQSLADYLDSGSLLHLKNLDLKVLKYSDQDLASFIGRMRGLRKFATLGSIGPLSLFGLRSHFHTLTEIQVLDARYLWCEALSSCPHLMMVKSCQLSASDILHGEAWICTSMKELHVHLLPEDEVHMSEAMTEATGTVQIQVQQASESGLHKVLLTLLSRLSKLENLEQLWIEGDLSYAEENTSDLVPANGLTMLSTLRRLRILTVCTDHWPDLHMESVEWIKKHWKSLKTLHGSWTARSQITSEAVWILRAHGVDVYWDSEHELNSGQLLRQSART